ncbi:hypothetical protein X975_07415, partial [Stegodyphus mimosarum]
MSTASEIIHPHVEKKHHRSKRMNYDIHVEREFVLKPVHTPQDGDHLTQSAMLNTSQEYFRSTHVGNSKLPR